MGGRGRARAMSRGVDWRHYAVVRSDRGDDELRTAIWPGQAPKPDDGDVHSLRVLTCTLRRLLAGSRFRIVRHRGRGYELVRVARQQPRGQQAEHGLAV
jgi:hypothetical protein